MVFDIIILNNLTLRFLFYGDKVTVIFVYIYIFQTCAFSHAFYFGNYLV